MFVPHYIDTDLFKEQVGTLAVFARAASVFVKSLPGWRARLYAAVDQNSFDLASDLVHQMKGASAMMCAIPLRDHLIVMERELRRGNAQGVADALEPLSVLLTETESELRLYWIGEDSAGKA